jgi:hypothetical protein
VCRWWVVGGGCVCRLGGEGGLCVIVWLGGWVEVLERVFPTTLNTDDANDTTTNLI